MKTREILIAMSLMCVMVLSGCQEQQAVEPGIDNGAVNRAIVDTYSDLAIQNAVISQHTLYPYHFVNNSVELNDLGMRDLTVLIDHFKTNPGTLMVRQGAVDGVLYQSRAQWVYEKLMEAGIPQEKIDISDGMPGGEGMPSTAVIEILERAKESDSYESEAMEVEF